MLISFNCICYLCRVTTMKVFVGVTSLFFTACIALSQGLAITQCNEDGFVSVEDRSRDFLLTCANLTNSSPTAWFFQPRNESTSTSSSSPILVSNCSSQASASDSPSWQCSRDFAATVYAHFQPYTRRSHVILSDVDRGRFPDGNWRCQNGDSVAECAIDVIYTPTDVRCQVTVDEVRGMVDGNCQMSRMFSSHNKYGCQWFEKDGNQSEMAVPSSQVQFTRSNCSDANYQYFCGNCSFSKLLPLVSESYRYRVVISPGNLSPAIEIKVKSINNNSQGETAYKNTNVTSAQPMTSLRPASIQTTLPADSPVTVWDGGAVDDARVKGIGVGIASTLAVVIFIAIIVFVVWKMKQRRKETDSRESSLHEVDNPAFDQRGSSGHEYCEILPSDVTIDDNPHSQESDTALHQPRDISRSNRDMSVTVPKVPFELEETEQNPPLASLPEASGGVQEVPTDSGKNLYLTPASPTGNGRSDVLLANSASA